MFVEYIWIGGNDEMRSKTRVLHNTNVIPVWDFDGSSTQQAQGTDSEIVLIPHTVFHDPIRGFPHKLVMCETAHPNGEFLGNRHWAEWLFNQALDEEPWFGLEQEYFILDPKTHYPLGYDKTKQQGQYYCSVGTENAFGRDIAEEHLKLCVGAGIKISGINAEVAPGQWEFQVGPCIGIESGDHLWVARYLLNRVGEKHGVIINYDPKPFHQLNGSGCHANYSTKHMREGSDTVTGLVFIDYAIETLSRKHLEHMSKYGTGNVTRMTGKHETADFYTFTHGIANRGDSVRRGNQTVRDEKGYFEDRRPASNCDPYLVTGMLFKTTVIDLM